MSDTASIAGQENGAAIAGLPGSGQGANRVESPPRQSRFIQMLTGYASKIDDGEILRWAFRGMLAVTVSVLAMDYFELQQKAPASELADPLQTTLPILPPAVDTNEPAKTNDPRQFLTTDQELLRQPMQFTLGAGGTLRAEGSIVPGTAPRLAAELEARGEYVKAVSLNSPGGALDEAMEMGRLVRSHGLTTEVIDGSLCASSCPLFLAGGKKRLAGAKSAIGVHQFYATTQLGQTAPAPGQAMSDAQTTTARITRYLEEMNVDPAAWLHALDTPPRALYYFSADEMSRYRLTTGIAKPAPGPAITSGTAG